jgi:hypothetical protein
MKKLYPLIAIMVFTVAVFAQSNQGLPFGNKPLHKPINVPEKFVDLSSRVTNALYIDYDTADAFLWSGSYSRFIWDHNWNYVAADSSLKYCVVAFDSLYDPYNLIGYPNSGVQSIVVDSILAAVGQENNSGTDDTLITKIVSLTAAGYPQNNVLWADTTIIPAGTPLSSPDWLNSVALSWAPGYAGNIQRFGVRMEYHGDKLDTFGVIAGFGSFTGPCGTNPSATLAQSSNFKPGKPNTFNFWTQYNQLLPTSTGGFIYYDCNGNGGYDAGSDGASYLQNMTIWVHVTISDQQVAVNEIEGNSMSLFTNTPNPFSDITNIRYKLEKAGNVQIKITDMAGRVISDLNEGFRSSGNHSVQYDGSQLSKGVYFFTLTTENGSITNKMVISR